MAQSRHRPCPPPQNLVLVLASCIARGEHALMPRGHQPGITSVSGLCVGAGSAAALALLSPAGSPVVGLLVATGLCGAWALAGAALVGRPAVLLLLPAFAALPGGGWIALVGWSAAALVTMWLLIQRHARVDPDQVRHLRAELRDAEHERTLLHRHIQRYPALLDACLELSAVRGLGQFARVLCERTQDLLPGITSVRVFLGTSQKLDCLASVDAEGNPVPGEAGEDQRYVAAEARPLIRRNGRVVHLLIPLRGDRRQGEASESLRGVLEVTLQTDDVGDRLAFELLGALGRLGGLGLAAVDLVNQARSLALRDDLTGLFGQHEFLRRLDEQAAACRRHGTELGLIMCDMDHLKRFNDRHGHPAGDTALRQVAATLTRVLPEDAIVCRYGGEEFAAIVVGRPLARLQLIASAIRGSIADEPVPVENGTAHVTASLGVAVMRDDETPRATLERADAACYAAKAAGRNRVEVAS
jgi:diguanylate cyclase (GGDEF)-like protein